MSIAKAMDAIARVPRRELSLSLLEAVSERAEGLYQAAAEREYELTGDATHDRRFRFQAWMDLSICHLICCPLRLSEMLTAPAMDFTHDVIGIRRHLDRENLVLMNCFMPRFAAVVERAA